MEFCRFLLVGFLATLTDALVMALVQYICEPTLYRSFWEIFTAQATGYVYVVGTACGFTAGLLVNYALSVVFVFNEKGKSRSVYGFFVFAVLSLVGLFIHVCGMYLGNTVLGINAWAVKIVLTAVVTVYNYVSKKLLLFKKGKDASSEEKNDAPSKEKNEND